MRLGAFEVNEPLPELKEPHVIAMLRPWIDAGNVGTLTLQWLEKNTHAMPLAELSRPGSYFDFTRYRPMTFFSHGQREVHLPNTRISYGRREEGHDFLFLHLLEPHMLGEIYVDSVLRVMEEFDVKRYCLIGSMYNFVPHTRPPLVSGGASSEELKLLLEKAGVSSSNYEGPTTICSLISQKAGDWGVESITMIVSLPQYTQLDDDYMGAVRLQSILSSLYGIPVDEDIIKKAQRQREQINEAVADNPQVREILEELEESYDERIGAREGEAETRPLSPEVEDFLREMERRFRRE